MEVIYISALISRNKVDSIYKHTGKNPGYAVQKFSRLLVRGLIDNGVKAFTLSNPPITRSESDKFWINYGREVEESISYRYIPFINLPIFKHICVFTYAFIYVLLWGLTNRRDKAIICDVLSISCCFGALLASKIIRIQSVAVVTDIYSQMVGESNYGLTQILKKMAGSIQKWYSTSFSKYILLTEAMNSLVNPRHRPFIVLEAICDTRDADESSQSIIGKDKPLTVLYAGGVEEKYGLKALAEGFHSLQRDDIRLVIYGHGGFVSSIREMSQDDHRIEYRGIAPNEEIVEAEKKATLLVNPRFTTEEFASFSFPSKNIEYMASGTPLLTTQLPGMPKEYYPYVYLFNKGESSQGYAIVMDEILSLSPETLNRKGQSAQEYVLKNKNAIVQIKRVIKLIEK